MNELNIISDIAGRYDELTLLLQKMPKNCKTIFVGDLNDRGPKSKEVIQYAIDNKDRILTLNSNHGDMFVDFYEGCKRYSYTDFLHNGGKATLRSYGIKFNEVCTTSNLLDFKKMFVWCKENIPHEHIEFLKSRPYYYIEDNIFISHAAKDSSRLLRDLCNDEDFGLLWNRREPDGNDKEIGDRLQIMGHNSHWGLMDIKNDSGKTYAICIDDSRKRKLTGLHYPSLNIYQQEYLND